MYPMPLVGAVMAGTGSTVFISYSWCDKWLADVLSSRLEARGFKAWVDSRVINIGDSVIEKICAAVAQADFVVAIVSRSSVSNPWCKREISLAITEELERRSTMVLPLRAGDVTMPRTLLDRAYVSLGSDIDTAVDRLVAAMTTHYLDRFPG